MPPSGLPGVTTRRLRKYSPPGSPIEVRARADDESIVLEVADHGDGIAAGDEERLFEKFYRGAHGKQTPGFGLGLTVCRGIVQAHGGRIDARNREVDGSGAIFRVVLPRPKEPGDAA